MLPVVAPVPERGLGDRFRLSLRGVLKFNSAVKVLPHTVMAAVRSGFACVDCWLPDQSFCGVQNCD